MKPVLLFGAAGASGAVDALAKAHSSSGKLSESMREKIGTVGSQHREDMPADAFLLGAERKYPVKVKEDGGWTYSPKLLLAAARRARMEGRDDLAAEADKIRARLEGGDQHSGEPMKKSILLFGAPGASEAIETLTKAHVAGYTRSDGTYVQEHEDGRADAPVASHNAMAAHHLAARESAKKAGDRDAERAHDSAWAAHTKAAEMHAKGSPKASAYSQEAYEESQTANSVFPHNKPSKKSTSEASKAAISHHKAMSAKHAAAATAARSAGNHDLAERHEEAGFQHDVAVGRHTHNRPDASRVSGVANNLSESLGVR